MTKPKTPHLVIVTPKPSEVRERHINALATEIRQSTERVLPALGFRSPQMRGGVWRVIDVPTCPSCGTSAPADRPDLVPWVFGSQRILCDGGCEIGVRELLDLFCKTNREIDAVLLKVQAGRPLLHRYYILELQLSQPAEGEEPKWRRVVSDDVTEALRRLDPSGEDIVRGVAVDATDLMTVQTLVRGESAIPWRERVPLDHRGRLLNVAWHGAPLSQAERELERRQAV